MSYGMIWALAQDEKKKSQSKPDNSCNYEPKSKGKEKVCPNCGGTNLSVGCTGTQIATACNDCLELINP